MKVFVDNDVILDVILERTGFEYSRELLTHIEAKQIEAYTSPLIFTNSFYIINKLKNKRIAWSGLKKIRLLFKVSLVDQKIIDLALASDFVDFEDAVQYYTALNQKVEYFITRNKKHYIDTQIPVVSPQECLAVLKVS